MLSIILTSSLVNAKEFDLEKYMGRWYEIYSVPNRFQRDCYNVTADYSIKENKNVKVINTCRAKGGSIKRDIEGEGVVKDLSKRYLKVYFYRPFGINVFGGDYYVLDLEENYKWAIVGTPNHKYGWILSRTETLSDKDLEIIKEKAEKLGYKWSQFKKTETK